MTVGLRSAEITKKKLPEKLDNLQESEMDKLTWRWSELTAGLAMVPACITSALLSGGESDGRGSQARAP